MENTWSIYTKYSGDFSGLSNGGVIDASTTEHNFNDSTHDTMSEGLSNEFIVLYCWRLSFSFNYMHMCI